MKTTASSVREELRLITSRLIKEFAGRLPAGTVIRCVANAREQLFRSGVRDGLATATEAAARRRLSALVPTQPRRD
jgi:hypothetical protein